MVDGRPVKASYKVAEGDLISFEVPEAVEPEIVPEDIPLDILYEDHDVILVNKPKGMVVHPAAGNPYRDSFRAEPVYYHFEGYLYPFRYRLR